MKDDWVQRKRKTHQTTRHSRDEAAVEGTCGKGWGHTHSDIMAPQEEHKRLTVVAKQSALKQQDAKGVAILNSHATSRVMVGEWRSISQCQRPEFVAWRPSTTFTDIPTLSRKGVVNHIPIVRLVWSFG